MTTEEIDRLLLNDTEVELADLLIEYGCLLERGEHCTKVLEQHGPDWFDAWMAGLAVMQRLATLRGAITDLSVVASILRHGVDGRRPEREEERGCCQGEME